MSIVVIEDDLDVCRCVREILKEEGFLVDAFASAEEALRHLARQPVPTLILLDLEAPGLDAVGFRARQLADPRLARVPLILLSARAEAASEARHLRAADFLMKPFFPEELLHVVQNRAMTVPRIEHFLRGALRPVRKT